MKILIDECVPAGLGAESWLTQQALYELAQVRADRIKLRRLALA